MQAGDQHSTCRKQKQLVYVMHNWVVEGMAAEGGAAAGMGLVYWSVQQEPLKDFILV